MNYSYTLLFYMGELELSVCLLVCFPVKLNANKKSKQREIAVWTLRVTEEGIYLSCCRFTDAHRKRHTDRQDGREAAVADCCSSLLTSPHTV